jgi:hypothetical protein
MNAQWIWSIPLKENNDLRARRYGRWYTKQIESNHIYYSIFSWSRFDSTGFHPIVLIYTYSTTIIRVSLSLSHTHTQNIV